MTKAQPKFWPFEKLPSAFLRFWEAGGVVGFSIFDDARGDEAWMLEAIATVIPDLDRGKLAELRYRQIGDREFYGEWYDSKTDSLVKRGWWHTRDGRKLVDPKFRDLDAAALAGGGGPIPEVGAGGQFAYAFSSPPYGLHAKPSEIQEMFVAIRDFILPLGLDHEIFDWSSPKLAEAAKLFERGLDWWGVFLFAVHVPAQRRLTLIVASTSD